MMQNPPVHPHLQQLELSVILPFVLLLNFGIFQYLVLLFHSKARHQPYALLLLLVSSLSVASLVPFATQPADTLAAMNDVSESCLALVLLVQTTFSLKNVRVIGFTGTCSPKVVTNESRGYCCNSWHSPRSRRRRACLAALKTMWAAADILILLDCGFVVLGIIGIFQPDMLEAFGGADELSKGLEVTTLAYTLIYRFLALALSKGFRAMLKEDGLELVAHIGFAMHEYPFLIAEHLKGLSWDLIQVVVMRLALIPCVWVTIGEHHYRRPMQNQLRRLSSTSLKELVHRASTISRAKTPSFSSISTGINPSEVGVTCSTTNRFSEGLKEGLGKPTATTNENE